jgi:hypothetical protein
VFQNLKWNVSIYSKNFGTKLKLFDLFQIFLKQQQNVSIYSKNLKTKPKRFDLVHKFLKPKLKKLNAFGSKILKSERECFGSIINFVSKTNMFDFLGDVSRKTKANDLEKTLV